MPVNLALGHVSNAFLIAALVLYSLSVVAFAGDFAFGRPRRGGAGAGGAGGRRRAWPAARSVARARTRRIRWSPRVRRVHRFPRVRRFPWLGRTGPRAAP